MEKVIVILSLFLLLPPKIPSKPSLTCFEPVEKTDCEEKTCRKPNNKHSNEVNGTEQATYVRKVRCSEMFTALGKVISTLAKGRGAVQPAPQGNHMKFIANLMGLGQARPPASNRAFWTFSTREPKRLLGRAVPKVYNSEGEEEDFSDMAEGTDWQLDHPEPEEEEERPSEGLLTRVFKPIGIFVKPIIEDLVKDEETS